MSTEERPTLRWVALVVLLAGGFLPPLDFFIVNVALSSIHESLGATPAELQLVISGYACGYGGLPDHRRPAGRPLRAQALLPESAWPASRWPAWAAASPPPPRNW